MKNNDVVIAGAVTQLVEAFESLGPGFSVTAIHFDDGKDGVYFYSRMCSSDFEPHVVYRMPNRMFACGVELVPSRRSK